MRHKKMTNVKCFLNWGGGSEQLFWELKGCLLLDYRASSPQAGSGDLLRALPLGGKYDLLSALWGQSTTRGPNLRKLAVISSTKQRRHLREKEKKHCKQNSIKHAFLYKKMFWEQFCKAFLQKANLLSKIPIAGGTFGHSLSSM